MQPNINTSNTATTPQTITQPTSVSAGGLNVEPLRKYEQGQQSASAISVIKADPALRKQLIIAIILTVTVLLALIGIIMAVIVFMKASKRANEEQLAAANSVFTDFAQQNGLQVVQDKSTITSANNPGLLDQYQHAVQGVAAVVPSALQGLTPAAEELPAVLGRLPQGLQYVIQPKHLSVNFEADHLADFINTSAFRINMGGLQIGSGNAFHSHTAGLRSLKGYMSDTVFFDVTASAPPGEQPTPGNTRTDIHAEYVFLTLSIFVGQKIMPHFLLLPKKAGFGMPLMPAQPENLTLEGNFNDYFDVYIPKGYQTEVLQLLEPNVMQDLMTDASDLAIEFVGNRMTFILTLRPYATPVALADGVSRLYGLASKYESWLQREFSSWNFQPQPLPYTLRAGDINARMVIDQINRTDPSHVSWKDNTAGVSVDQASGSSVGPEAPTQ